jgi:hypothetical protein
MKSSTKKQALLIATAILITLFVLSTLTFALTWYYSPVQTSKVTAAGVAGVSVELNLVPVNLTQYSTVDFTGTVTAGGLPLVGVTVNMVVNGTMIYATGISNSTGQYSILWTVTNPVGDTLNWSAAVQQ